MKVDFTLRDGFKDLDVESFLEDVRFIRIALRMRYEYSSLTFNAKTFSRLSWYACVFSGGLCTVWNASALSYCYTQLERHHPTIILRKSVLLSDIPPLDGTE